MSLAKPLFLGQMNLDSIRPFPKMATEEVEVVKMITESVNRFFLNREKELAEADKIGKFAEGYLNELSTMGLFGLIIGEEYGGIGLSSAGYSRVMQEISRYDASTSVTLGAHSSIGMKGILLFGTNEQKSQYLPKLATGEHKAAFCLTEPSSGSDAASIKTTYTVNEDGSFTLNGEKLWISNGAFAEIFTVFARGTGENKEINAFIVERAFGGVISGPKEDKMGIRASETTSVRFENTVVPKQNLLGDFAGGFKVAMEILNNGRTGLGGGCVGAMKQMIAYAIAQAKNRKQFGKAIIEFPIIREKIGRMSALCYGAESVVRVVSHLIDSQSNDYGIEAAISKIVATEATWEVCFEALQIAGGNGFMREYPYERFTRDARINLIFEGTNEILRQFIALNGLKVVGDRLKNIKEQSEINKIDAAKNYLSLKFGALAAKEKEFSNAQFKISNFSEKLIRTYGKKVVERQLPLKRLADGVIETFVAGVASVRAETSSDLAEKKCVEYLKHRSYLAVSKLGDLENSLEKSSMLIADKIIEHDGYIWDLF